MSYVCFTVSACFVCRIVNGDGEIVRRTLARSERLRGKSRIDRLFAEGKGVLVFPLRCVFVRGGDDGSVAVLFSVPKKRFKRAVKRNLLRRRMKEAYRLNKSRLAGAIDGRGLDMAVMYIGNDVADFAFVQSRMSLLLDKVASKLACLE